MRDLDCVYGDDGWRREWMIGWSHFAWVKGLKLLADILFSLLKNIEERIALHDA